ncbi:MAG: hypothetical protein KF799_02665 [Bdellovibrionales bacterium]|nr:hypothetical protein [Bdellovibrionales bacterium]
MGKSWHGRFVQIIRACAWALALSGSLPLQAQVSPLQVRDDGQSDLRYLVDRLDELAGGTRTDDNRNSSSLRFTFADRTSRFSRAHASLDVRFAMKLGLLLQWQKEIQNWSNRLIEREERKIFPQEARKRMAQIEQETSDLSTPAQPTREEKDPWRFTLEKHFVAAIHPSLWVHARVSKDLETGKLLHNFSAQFGWSLDDLWQARTGLVSHMMLAPKWAFAFSNHVDYLISDRRFTVSQGPTLSYLPTDNQSFSLSAGVGSEVVDKVYAAQGYGLTLGYNLDAWKQWVIVGVNTAVGWARATRFAPDPGVGGSVQVVF